MQSVIVLEGFIKQIKLLMITMELAPSEGNFTHSYTHWLIDVFESILSRNTEYLVMKFQMKIQMKFL